MSAFRWPLPLLLAVRQVPCMDFARHCWNSYEQSPDEVSVNRLGIGLEQVVIMVMMLRLSRIR
jgi:hypothetical protein